MLNILTQPKPYASALSTQKITLHWFFYQGYNNQDEHVQIFEFASYKLHHYPFDYPWDLNAKIRPTMQIWGVLGLWYLFLNISPFAVVFLTKLFAGLLSSYASYLFFQILQSWFLL